MLKSSIVVGILTVALLSPGNAAVSDPRAAAAVTEFFKSATPTTWVCNPQMRLETRMARVHPAMGRRLGSTPSARVLLRETPDRLGGSLSIVSCCLKARRVDRTYVATI